MTETSTTAAPSPHLLLPKLSVMMFLQYAIWGAWLPILYPFLLGHRGMSLDQVGSILAGGAAGAIVGPVIAGQVADRYFATEKFLALSHLIGAGLVWFLAGISDFWTFFAVSVLYGVVYAPTLALTNSISFHHLPDRDRQFGKVRVWGTVGWIAAGILVGQWLATTHSPGELRDAVAAAASAVSELESSPTSPEQIESARGSLADARASLEAQQNAGRADAFRLSAILGLIMAIYCLFLPRTPPAKDAKEPFAAWEALREVRRQPLVTLFFLAVPISIIHQFYFVHTSQFLTEIQNRGGGGTGLSSAINSVFGVGGGGLMTIGQMTEIAVLALIPLVAKRAGRKLLLGIGIAAYAVRMALFAYHEQIAGALGLPEVVVAILGVALHGLCFGCFIFVAFMVVDEETTPDVRASAQNLFNLVIVGIGIIAGSWFATSVVGKMARMESGGTDYTTLFTVPMWGALVCLIALLVFYPRKSNPIEPSPPDA